MTISVPEALEQAAETGDKKLTAICIAVLAVLLAICSIGDDDASKTAVRTNSQASIQPFELIAPCKLHAGFA